MPFQPARRPKGEGRKKEREMKFVSKNLGDRREKGRRREFVRDSSTKRNLEEKKGEEVRKRVR